MRARRGQICARTKLISGYDLPAPGMRIYSVGGSVRDELLGLPVKDRDWVVVGSTPEDMERLGYKPVGKDFPVFLHPQTKEEYALARTERKVARGYKGFEVRASPDVTLEQDLARRDLTINAIARDETGALIDPFGGARDLKSGVLRHVSAAFSEDPVRILRVARFAARYGFSVAPETDALMRAMVAQGEADALVAERVWREFAGGLMEPDPWRMLAVLADCGLLARWLPELAIVTESGQPGDEPSAIVARSLRFAAREGHSLAVRFALMTRGARSPRERLERVCARLKVSAECRDLALLCARQMGRALAAAELGAEELLRLLEASDAFRRPRRLEELIRAAQAEASGAGSGNAVAAATSINAALGAARRVDAAAISKAGSDIAARVRSARLARIIGALVKARRKTSRR